MQARIVVREVGYGWATDLLTDLDSRPIRLHVERPRCGEGGDVLRQRALRWAHKFKKRMFVLSEVEVLKTRSEELVAMIEERLDDEGA